MRKMLSILSTLAVLTGLAAVGPTATADDDPPSPPDPMHRVNAWRPQPPGTVTTIKLQYGPYVVHPGSDLSRVDVEIAGANGFVIAAKPSARLVDGTQPPHTDLHIHHAHWVWLDENAAGYNRWFFGTGEEETRGSVEESALADPRAQTEGLRYGIQLTQGDKLGFISMLHNKTAEPMTVWLEGEMTFVHGTREQILAATGKDYHPLTPVLHGTTFNVPRVGGDYTWPLDTDINNGSIQGDLGHIWTAPWDGTIIIGAGHLHPGGKEVVVSNLGRQDSPCADEGDGIPGKTILRIPAFYRDGVFPSEEFQMGISKAGWRAKVRQGDRIAINGTYDASAYAYPDAMSFFGFYADREQPPAAGEECSVERVDAPDAPIDDVIQAVPNRTWSGEALDTCSEPCDDLSRPLPAPGPVTDTVTIAGFQYLPGNQGSAETTGAPVFEKGSTVRFVNADWAAGLVRHTITTCKTPCNGAYVANYPFHDGEIESGALGMTPVDTYINVNQEPMWELDTSDVDEGYYTYFCRLHPWMRGSFYVQ